MGFEGCFVNRAGVVKGRKHLRDRESLHFHDLHLDVKARKKKVKSSVAAQGIKIGLFQPQQANSHNSRLLNDAKSSSAAARKEMGRDWGDGRASFVLDSRNDAIEGIWKGDKVLWRSSLDGATPRKGLLDITDLPAEKTRLSNPIILTITGYIGWR
ncbi:hypothetical protein Nepgr_015138 [Nepenthes gracilis]|uniref:Uncharacterized protein n=1 Tax=Nepenthes gracilis TaxID=150966 RepID=A0AAD3SLL3_NEPGR|nr:hypothetical protein Nepgr_015138 [Nepenthes gracilis]